MNLRENIKTERVLQADRLAKAPPLVGRVPSLWLACYPIFQDALRYGETTFRTLPQFAKLVVLKRTTIDTAEQVIASRILDDVGVSYIELDTPYVDEAAQSYLARHADDGYGQNASRSTSLDELTAQIAPMNYPLTERPPCVLRPGQGVFHDGWMRFFAYRSRGDLTIPLLAIDWLGFHDRLGTLRLTAI